MLTDENSVDALWVIPMGEAIDDNGVYISVFELFTGFDGLGLFICPSSTFKL